MHRIPSCDYNSFQSRGRSGEGRDLLSNHFKMTSSHRGGSADKHTTGGISGRLAALSLQQGVKN